MIEFCIAVAMCSYLEMNTVEFSLMEALDAVITQGTVQSKERKLPLICDSPAEASTMFLYGDNLRLQQVLSDFLSNVLHFTPPSEGSVVLKVIPRKELIGTGVHIIHLEFR